MADRLEQHLRSVGWANDDLNYEALARAALTATPPRPSVPAGGCVAFVTAWHSDWQRAPLAHDDDKTAWQTAFDIAHRLDAAFAAAPEAPCPSVPDELVRLSEAATPGEFEVTGGATEQFAAACINYVRGIIKGDAR